MKNTVSKYIPDLFLALIYFIAIQYILKYYPVPQFTWDSFYYVGVSITHEYGVRPIGYSIFLNILYYFSESIHFVALVQFFIFFICAVFFLKVLRRIFSFSTPAYLIMGLLILLEPASLYHANTILSDSLFYSFTMAAFGFLLYYLNTGRYWALLVHILLVLVCIELRYIALFYPFFSSGILLLFTRKNRVSLIGIVVFIAAFFLLQKMHIDYNKKRYGVPVYTAFSGWTHTNNALYALPRINLNPKFIENPDIRQMHAFFKTYLDTSSFVVHQVGSGYLWDERSPMNVIRKKYADDLNLDYNTSWYYSAPYFHHYGVFIQRNFPYEYVMSYMVPNLKTLLHPELGEMGDYFTTPFFAPVVLEHYHLVESEVKPFRQIYKENINAGISKGYSILLLLFGVCSIVLLFYAKRLNKEELTTALTLISFVVAFYGLTLYSSWFMFRYLLPVYPLMICTIYLVVMLFIKKRLWIADKNKKISFILK